VTELDNSQVSLSTEKCPTANDADDGCNGAGFGYLDVERGRARFGGLRRGIGSSGWSRESGAVT
jgi:hypothetical protein